jgi:uncharacterized protein (TIGR02391 family)
VVKSPFKGRNLLDTALRAGRILIVPAQPSFEAVTLDQLCQVLAEGISGSEIGRLLDVLAIEDPQPGGTKWRRLAIAFERQQQQDRCGNKVLAFLMEAMRPVRFVGKSNEFEERRAALNHVLVFVGLEIQSDGNLRTGIAAKTLAEADQRAGRLRAELSRRNVHPEVLRFCRAELLENNYFHAVLEASKSVSEKIRCRTGLTGDGGDLAEKALALGQAGMPYLAFNTLRTESEQSEQKGLMNLMKGFFGTFRNTTAHAARIHWNINEQDAVDLLTMASFLHRRLDAAARTPKPI